MPSSKTLFLHLPEFRWDWLMDEAKEKYFSNLVWLIDHGCSKQFAPVGTQSIVASVLTTGRCPAETGLTSYWSEREDGIGMRRTERSDVSAPLLWELVGQAGYTVAALNFVGTHHMIESIGSVFSDRFAEFRPDDSSHWPVPVGSVSPENLAETFSQYRWHPAVVNRDELLGMVDQGATRQNDNVSDAIVNSMCKHATYHNLVTHYCQDESIDFIAARYSLLEDFRHTLGGQAKDAVQKSLCSQISFHLSWFLDQCVGRIRATMSDTDKLVITGGKESPFVILCGAGVEQDKLLQADVDIFDVVPTILASFSLSAPGLRGRSFVPDWSIDNQSMIKSDSVTNREDWKLHNSFSLSKPITPSQSEVDEVTDQRKASDIALLDYAEKTKNEPLKEMLLSRLRNYFL